MISTKTVKNSCGFSLVELLVTVVIMGLVVTSIYGLHQSMQKSQQSGEVVGELQQNLRVGMEFITRDVQLAGFLVPDPDNQPPILSAPAVGLVNAGSGCWDDGGWSAGTVDTGDTCFVMRTAAPNGLMARIEGVIEDPTKPLVIRFGTGTTTGVRLYIANDRMVSFFSGASSVRIIRPGLNEPLYFPDAYFPVSATSTATTPPTITLGNGSRSSDATVVSFGATDGASLISGVDTLVQNGDILVQSDAAHPNTIAYFRSGNNLMRQENTDDPEVVAENVSDLRFEYQRDTGGTGLEKIRSVRVTIEGEHFFHSADEKTRTVRSSIRLRNR